MAKDARPSARERGYTRKWEQARKAFLASNPTCACGAPATIVDHKTPHRGDLKLFWSRSNWQPMCVPCHGRKTVRQDGGFGNARCEDWTPRGACDDTGRPLDRGHWWNGGR
jgi:5-methylcytosine-specific restriction protein A